MNFNLFLTESLNETKSDGAKKSKNMKKADKEKATHLLSSQEIRGMVFNKEIILNDSQDYC